MLMMPAEIEELEGAGVRSVIDGQAPAARDRLF
jgi:hypothetical protein